MTLLEMVIALAIMAIVFAAVVPQFRIIQNNWDSKQGSAEALQNSRVLADHLNHNLSKAVKITDVSDSDETNGYIEFEDNDGNNVRYDVNSTTSYVEFGQTDSLSDLAGPVSQFQFTCYDACDLDTSLTAPIDANEIRIVQVQATVTNPSEQGQDKTLTAVAYLRVNANASDGPCSLVGWWKLDETSGTTAADSSGNGNDGTLTSMAGDEWTTGQVDGALEFDGTNDYIDVSSLSATTDKTFSCWIYANSLTADFTTLIEFGSDAPWFGVAEWSGNWYLLEYDKNCWGQTRLSTGQWYHIAYTSDSSTNSSKVYLNGVEDTEFAANANTETGSGMGIAYHNGDTCFNGIIDDVRVYDRALTADEISQLAGCWRLSDQTAFEYDIAAGKTPGLVQIDSSHYLCAYNGPDKDLGWAVILAVDTDNWTISNGTALNYDATRGKEPALAQIDSTHYLCAYQGDSDHGWATVLTVNTDTWAITNQTPFEYDETAGITPALEQIDSTHYLCAYTYGGKDDDGWAVVLTVDSGTWDITGGTPFEYDTEQGKTPALAQIDTNHYLCAYTCKDDDGSAIVLTVDTGTWNITGGTPFEYDTVNGKTPALTQIDSTHYLCVYAGNEDDGWAIVLTVDTGTWDITGGTPFEHDTVQGKTPALVQIDNTHYLCVYAGDEDHGWAIVLTVDTGTWDIAGGMPFEYDTEKGKTPALAQIDTNHYLCPYAGQDDDGWSNVLTVSTGVDPNAGDCDGTQILP